MWKQPTFIIIGENNENIIINPAFRGYAFINTAYFKVTNKYNISILAETGYKTGGYLEGEILAKGLILRGGLSFRFEK